MRKARLNPVETVHADQMASSVKAICGLSYEEIILRLRILDLKADLAEATARGERAEKALALIGNKGARHG